MVSKEGGADKISRRQFLFREAPLGVAGIFMLGGIGYELVHTFGHHEEKKDTQDIADILSNDPKNTEQVEQKLNKYRDPVRQKILNAAMTLLFGSMVLTKFLDNNHGSAALNVALLISGYLTLSNSETRQAVKKVMMSSWGGVSMIMGFAQLGECFDIDTDSIFKKLYRHRDLNQINAYYNNLASPIRNFLHNHNIYVDVSNEYRQEVYVYLNGQESKVNGKIFVSQGLFLELLPLFISHSCNDNLASIIKDTIKRHTKLIDADNNIDHIIDTKQENDAEYHLAQSEKSAITATLIATVKSEMQAIAVLFYLTQLLPLFGVGQVAVFKDKIHTLIHTVYQLAIAQGYSEHEAMSVKGSLLSLVTSYFPNRLAITSDIGPNTGGLQKGGGTGVLMLWKEQIAIAGVSGVSFFLQLNKILSTLLPSSSDDESDAGQKNIKKTLSLFSKSIGGLFQGIAVSGAEFGSAVSLQGATALKDVGEKLASSNYSDLLPLRFDATRNEASRKYSLRNTPVGVSQSIDLENKSLLDGIGTGILLELQKTKKQFPGKTTVKLPDEESVTFDNALEICYFIKLVLEACEDDAIKKLYLKILRSNEKLFTGIQKDLHDGHIHEDLAIFLDTYFKQEREYSDSELYEILFDPIVNLSTDIPLVADLELSRNVSHTYTPSSIQGATAMLVNNIKFLAWGKSKNKESYDQYETNFIAKCKDIIIHWSSITWHTDKAGKSITSKDFLLGGLSTKLTKDEVDLFNSRNIAIDGNSDPIHLEEANKDENSRKAWDILNTMGDAFLDLPIPGTIYTLRDLKEKVVQGRDKFESSYDAFKHMMEQYIGINSWEVFQMIFLFQSPFVHAVKSTIEEGIQQTIQALHLDPKKDALIIETIIASAVYGLSMFADNYIGLMVGIELCESILGYTPLQGIEKMGKFSIYGGSQVVTGNAPNPLLALFQKWFDTYSATPIAEQEKYALEQTIEKLKNNTDPERIVLWEKFKKQLALDASVSRIVDLLADIFMLSLVNNKSSPLSQSLGLLMLGSRGSELGNSTAKALVQKITSSIALLLTPLKMLFTARK